MTAPATIHRYQPIYHGPGERCPSCNGRSWYVGRITATCAMCSTALPLADVSAQPMEPRFTNHFSSTAGKFPRIAGV